MSSEFTPYKELGRSVILQAVEDTHFPLLCYCEDKGMRHLDPAGGDVEFQRMHRDRERAIRFLKSGEVDRWASAAEIHLDDVRRAAEKEAVVPRVVCKNNKRKKKRGCKEICEGAGAWT